MPESSLGVAQDSLRGREQALGIQGGDRLGVPATGYSSRPSEAVSGAHLGRTRHGDDVTKTPATSPTAPTSSSTTTRPKRSFAGSSPSFEPVSRPSPRASTESTRPPSRRCATWRRSRRASLKITCWRDLSTVSLCLILMPSSAQFKSSACTSTEPRATRESSPTSAVPSSSASPRPSALCALPPSRIMRRISGPTCFALLSLARNQDRGSTPRSFSHLWSS
ncbi:hypothetical protein BCR35DRAFT_160423 [Leucosporidium creatinivorum]|uniref:Uncharacterized protein n=1 Tax=Leucosporidium creatinivorum TaxID=106004 RepID=A0A1Y2EPE5_9BASI|nr:hypothetical protein BCR35DRAFT_160423 [Leucosporidium creatinivorum]